MFNVSVVELEKQGFESLTLGNVWVCWVCPLELKGLPVTCIFWSVQLTLHCPGYTALYTMSDWMLVLQVCLSLKHSGNRIAWEFSFRG